jgi:hypothetical protein
MDRSGNLVPRRRPPHRDPTDETRVPNYRDDRSAVGMVDISRYREPTRRAAAVMAPSLQWQRSARLHRQLRRPPDDRGTSRSSCSKPFVARNRDLLPLKTAYERSFTSTSTPSTHRYNPELRGKPVAVADLTSARNRCGCKLRYPQIRYPIGHAFGGSEAAARRISSTNVKDPLTQQTACISEVA